MFDNLAGFFGVTASIFTSALFAAAEAPQMTGWENVGAITILGFTMYYLLANINNKLDTLADTIKELQIEIKSKNED